MPNLPEHGGARASDEERDYVLSLLQDAYAEGRLTLEDMSERQSRALQATYRDEFVDLLRDLPGGDAAMSAIAEQQRSHPPVAFQRFGAAVPGTPQQATAFFGDKRLQLTPTSRRARARSFFGDTKVDACPAFAPGTVVEVDARMLCGDVQVYVPEGVRVEDRTTTVFGDVSIKKHAEGDGSNGTLLITGFLLFGDVEVLPESKPHRG